MSKLTKPWVGIDRAYNRIRKKDLEKSLVADGTEFGKGMKKKLRKAKERTYVEL